MASISRLFGMASRAVEKMTSEQGGQRSASRSHAAGGASGSRDWRDMVRQAADAVTGDGRTRPDTAPPADRYAPPAPGTTPGRYAPPSAAGSTAPLSPQDKAAIARYDYLLRTADPEQVERMHREAFERLTPEQRAHVRARMDAELSPHERPRSDAAGDLALTAARTEARQPGRMSTLLARAGRGGLIGAGVVGAGGLLAAVAGGAIVSAVAAPLLAQAGQMGVDFAGMAEGVDLEALASGADLGAVGDWAGGAQDAVSGVGDQVSGFGEQLSNFEIPGLGDFFGR